jgi:RNA polymerase sigma-70 factor (sigma-E family)
VGVVGSGFVVTQAEPTTVAFEAFYRAEYPRAVRLAFLLTRSDLAAEDLAQEAFAAVHARYTELAAPAGYLRTCVVNGCRRWHRSRAREGRRLELARPVEQTTETGAGELLDAVASLPYRHRAVIVLRYWADCSEQEIADALGCRPGTVKSIASRALARLREEVER